MDNKEQNNPTEEPEDGLVVQPEITTDDNPLVTGGPTMDVPDRNDDEPESTPPSGDDEE